VLVFDTGDEAVSGIRDVAKRERLQASQLTDIGAFSEVVLGYFDWNAKTYRRIPLGEQLHAHVVVGKQDGTAHGGHLLEARVRPTLEIVVVESPQHSRRVHDQASGLALIDLG
jgi:predicted DNA-binding protein with PD1-like motif